MAEKTPQNHLAELEAAYRERYRIEEAVMAALWQPKPTIITPDEERAVYSKGVFRGAKSSKLPSLDFYDNRPDRYDDGTLAPYQARFGKWSWE
ncbi:hypothetical protein IPG41_06095 [Candidatus Peregrinibacteria bacterium]|nr:MAG: hypothetical protein IPG41_06095 [Candidatus Peregrinibacteria bacterium]